MKSLRINLVSLSKLFLLQFSRNDTHSPFTTRGHFQSAIEWLSLAQDVTGDNGVSLRYSLIHGWDSSYPETTGYIIPTFFNYYNLTRSNEYKVRAIKMADWELSIQQPDGSFLGGALGGNLGSFVFDTGQVIFGLIDAFKNTSNNDYIESAIKAGNWLVSVQDNDGAWRRYALHEIPHSYYARVSWALSYLFHTVQEKKFEKSARKNINWTLKLQRLNGWFENASFRIENHAMPNTHTIAYTIRGILETGICLNEEKYIVATQKSADALLDHITPEGFFWATYNEKWEETSNYSCLTGNAQISIIFLRLFQLTGEIKYLEASNLLNNYLKSKQNLEIKDRRIRGAIAGSYPIWGNYQRLAFPNWATKFFIDALLLEESIGQ